MRYRVHACLLFFVFSSSCPPCLGGELSGLRLPAGFQVTEFADAKLANDIYCLTFDPRGRVVVSGPGYVRLLIDGGGDGRADRAVDLVPGLKDGPQGLFWEGDTLYFMADGGLRRVRIEDDKPAGPAELVRRMKTGGEHDSHAILRGPDGWLYVLCGNNAGIDKTYATLTTSPISEPVAGCVLRFTPDLKNSEIVADGFRNAYGMDFTLDGELVTFDSDNERCVSLPWYEPTRFYHVVPGGHYGWLSPQRASFWRMPPYFCDVIPPVATLGRGSPTGVACYRHQQFPESYRGGVFLADWTFGRIWFLSLKHSRATYAAEKRLFLEAVGENGFAPTALAVHPTNGDLFVSIGGRGTRGAVYRIRHAEEFKQLPVGSKAMPPVRRDLDWRPELEKTLPREASSPDTFARFRALVAMRRHRSHFDGDALKRAVRANWDHDDRLVRLACAELLARLNREDRTELGKEATSPWRVVTWCLANGEPREAPRIHEEVLKQASHVLGAWEMPPLTSVESRLAAVRVIQRATCNIGDAKSRGTIWEGYSLDNAFGFRPPERTLKALRWDFPTGHAELDRELSRTLAICEDDDARFLERVSERLTAASDPVDDVHYLIVLARLRAPRSPAITKRVAGAVLGLDRKLTEGGHNRDTNWPLRLRELYAELARKDADLNAAVLASAGFGRPDHALFAECPGFDRRRAAEIFLERAAKDADFTWTPALVRLLGELPDDKSLPVLRRLWDRGGLEEAILPLLARRPQAEDREKFLEGIDSPRLATVETCLDAFDKLPGANDSALTLALIRALRSLPDGREGDRFRQRIAAKLRELTGKKSLGTDKEAWSRWFANHPQLAAKLGGDDGVDVEGWNRRLAKIDWSRGDAERGRAVFTKASCAACHSGGQALGPDLRGAAGRFSRDDLFTAILQPSKDVSPRYRTTLLATADGKTYQGIVIYDAVDSLILQTGPDATVRLTNPRIVERRTLTKSLMPAGLLDKLTDRNVADLYAHLKTLR
ncbi:MAG TPA: c-type cytochrome [Gemmataceae bacterium]|nr:c-type cytochrome [Gemmataceae bacterium]